MAKTIEFTVEVGNVLGGTESKVYFQRNLDRLLHTLPKGIKRRWTKIEWSENGEFKELSKDDYLETINAE